MNAFGGDAAHDAGSSRPLSGPDRPEAGRSARLSSGSEFYPGLEQWLPVIRSLGIADAVGRQVALQAAVDGVDFQTSLLAAGVVDEQRFYRAAAAVLGVSYLQSIDPDILILRDRQCADLLQREAGTYGIGLLYKDGRPRQLLATASKSLAALAGLSGSDLRSRLTMAAPSVVRAALMARARVTLLRAATERLLEVHPEFSARRVLSARQGFVFGVFCVMVPMVMFFFAQVAIDAVHWMASLFFMAGILLRLAAVSTAAPPVLMPLAPVRPAEMPIYTVLVALYREQEIIPELLVALGRLKWPRGKLEIKLVCEADDAETISAIRAHALRPWVEVIEVPASEPRTKPKALAYALQMTRGEFVVLYDAEDKPHRDQLIEAWQKFASGDPDIGCVQAPLMMTNEQHGFWARMFAFEYAALFRGLLPWLARHRLVLPLGGTSNHFRRSVLDEAGGWDPYNVTEDADLGLRLVRLGYRTEMISRPTFEDAPEDFRTWRPQRIRWFKGWIQTWLVHMRSPLRLAADLGPVSFLISQLLFAGIVISALIHPILLYSVGSIVSDLVAGKVPMRWGSALFYLDIANILLGYLSFWLLGGKTLLKKERAGVWKVGYYTIAYWLMQTMAAILAFWELWRRPHTWNKTPHRRSRRFAQTRPVPRQAAS